MAKALAVQYRAMDEGPYSANRMHSTQQFAQKIEVVEIIQLWPMAALARNQCKLKALILKQALARLIHHG